ncbi:MAG: hypothetical protein RCH30_4510 [Candidatus Phytoplasma australasiaticum]|nr:hypothetical protein EPWB_v2c1350 ['Echinacea purpurea' witches'-broom phytoplasma]WMW50323.1 MAG: hypothetical protein RCH30_4510 [Candidatus Phytoplasma australasiaticum]
MFNEKFYLGIKQNVLIKVLNIIVLYNFIKFTIKMENDKH